LFINFFINWILRPPCIILGKLYMNGTIYKHPCLKTNKNYICHYNWHVEIHIILNNFIANFYCFLSYVFSQLGGHWICIKFDVLIFLQMVLVASLKGLTPWAPSSITHHVNERDRFQSWLVWWQPSLSKFNQNCLSTLARGFQTWGPDIDGGHNFFYVIIMLK
jgi:hypothetical protein